MDADSTFDRNPAWRWAILLGALLPFAAAGCRSSGPTDEQLMEQAEHGATPLERETATVLLGRRGAAELRATPREGLAGFLDSSPNVARLRKLLGQVADPSVQAAAVDGLAGMRDIDSIPAVLDLLESPSALVRLRACQGAARLMGFVPMMRLAFDPEGDVADRARAIAAYRKEYALTFGPSARARLQVRQSMGPESMINPGAPSPEQGGSP